MNIGVKTLLSRMDSHPEEFELDLDILKLKNEKWSWVLDIVLGRTGHILDTFAQAVQPTFILTPEEAQALHDKLFSIQSAAFTKRVMRTLLEGGDEA